MSPFARAGCHRFFNADPHPGNIFVTIESRDEYVRNEDDDDDDDAIEDDDERRGTVTRRVRPVLLDFGMTVQLEEQVRIVTVGSAKHESVCPFPAPQKVFVFEQTYYGS